MPFIAPAIQVSVLGTQADGPFANVFALHTDAFTPAAADGAQAVLDAYVSHILPKLTDSIVVTSATYVDLSTSSGDTGEVIPTSGLTTTGAVHVDASPPQCTYLVKLSTAGGRSTRGGRTFLPGVRSDEVNERGDITTGTVSAITTAYQDFMDALVSSESGQLGILHRNVSGPGSCTDVTSAVCESTIATQRRRLRR